MGYVAILMLFVLGALAVPGLILAKRPDAKAMLDKITPFQGWIGAVAALWGVYWLIFYSILNLDLMGAGLAGLLLWITLTVEAVVFVSLGLLLGVGTIKTFVKNPQAQEKMDAMILKLAPKQGLLGIVSLITGVWALLFDLVIWNILI